MSELTHEERLERVLKIQAAEDRGDHEEADRLRLEIPLAPHLAKVAKEMFGGDWLIKSGFDLSEVEKAYGKEWINS